MRSDIIDRLKIFEKCLSWSSEHNLIMETIETIESLRDEICRLESLVGELEKTAESTLYSRKF